MSSRDNISLGEKIDKPANSTEGLVLLNPGACHIVRQKPNKPSTRWKAKPEKPKEKSDPIAIVLNEDEIFAYFVHRDDGVLVRRGQSDFPIHNVLLCFGTPGP